MSTPHEQPSSASTQPPDPGIQESGFESPESASGTQQAVDEEQASSHSDHPDGAGSAVPPPGQEAEQKIGEVSLYRRAKVVVPVLIIVIAVAVAGWFWYINQRDYVSTDDAYVDGYRSTVSAKMLGRVAVLEVDEGDTVHMGQVLVRLDTADLQAQEAQSRAALELAEQNIILADVGISKAEEDFARADTQFSDGVIPREQYDHAKQARDAARARRAVAVAQASATRAQLRVIEVQMRNATVIAPIDGVISKRWVLTGDVVQPGQAIFSVYDRRDVWVTANLEETSLALLRVGDSVGLSVDAYPDMDFSGRVLQIGANTAAQFSLIPPNNASGNFTKVTQRVPVKISIAPQSEDHSIHLLPGMSVEVHIRVR